MQEGRPIAYASKTLNETQQRYAVMKKELSAVLFACNKFDFYIYGKQHVIIHSDHKPLETLYKRPIDEITIRLQRMMMALQRYDLEIIYKPGKEMYIADTLSRAPENNADVNTIEEIYNTNNLAVSPKRLLRIQNATEDDETSKILKEYTIAGWPRQKEIRDETRDYYLIRKSITTNDKLIFKEDKLIVPQMLRKEMLNLAHANHGGIGSCLRRIREVMYWPGMTKQMTENVKTCETCMKFAGNNKGNQELIQHEIGETPWTKLGVDLCEIEGRQLLVVTDYYSSFISVAKLKTTTTTETNLQLLNMFAIHGIPQKFISDNGPQFRTDYKKFAESLDIEVIQSSPYYPKSNGKVVNAVTTVKRLFRKAKENNRSEQLTLLEWNNTIAEHEEVSPSEKLFGRKSRTLLPMNKTLLIPRENRTKEKEDMKRKKEKQKEYYDRAIRNYEDIYPEDEILIKLPRKKTWTKGKCKQEVNTRSYKLEVENAEYIRNRKDIKILKKEEREKNDEITIDIPEEIDKEEMQDKRPTRQRWLPAKLGGGTIN